MTRPSTIPASRYAWSGLAAVTVTAPAWAWAFVGIRYVGQAFAPGPLALGRLAGGSGALDAAEQRVDAGTTAMLVSIGPVLIALFARCAAGRGPRDRRPA
ncbi:hypothetical protein [Pseudonocardia sp. H11422]|uniref:hypothetical protein n=1 Tax=Pseudonocardia sp. H11422 TaxID=2835866 RepID=UPI001BDCA4E9|nr:hypothetical protein [Pseudonocardia sp. H11422]